jgi:uncharacterized protein (TIGR01244 family)
MSIQVNQIAPDVYAAGQLDASAMTELAKAGIRSVVNNRPDFEGGPTQPTHADIEAAARAAGLSYAYLPVVAGQQTPQQVQQLAQLLEQLPRPLLLFCRTGTRSTHLYRSAVPPQG